MRIHTGLWLALVFLVACKSAPESSAPSTPGSPAPALEVTKSTPTATGKPGAAEGPEIGTLYDDKTRTIEAEPGQRFTVALPANITTSMKWELSSETDQSVARLVEQSYQDDPPDGCCVGYGGTRLLHFHAVGIGPTTLRLLWKDVGAPNDPPAKEVEIQVRVEQP